MIPLASILGDATECLAEHLSETVGGLLNATFGNAVEIVVMIFALMKAKSYEDNDNTKGKDALLLVVQTSLIGGTTTSGNNGTTTNNNGYTLGRAGGTTTLVDFIWSNYHRIFVYIWSSFGVM